MATATPRASNPPLPGIFSGARFTLGKRIVLSFGALFVLMLVMAAVSYTRLRSIDDEAVSIGRDSVPGLYLATSLRASTNESYLTLERAIFVDGDADATKRDVDRLAILQHQFDQFSAEYQNTLFHDDDRQRFNAFKAAYDRYLPLVNEVARQGVISKPAAQAAFGSRKMWR